MSGKPDGNEPITVEVRQTHIEEGNPASPNR